MFAMIAKEAALIATLTTSLPELPPSDEISCMARNLYFEARGEDIKGLSAVANVTLNRVKSSRYPDTVCEVVAEDRGPGSYDCQFSWFCDGKSDTPKNEDLYEFMVRFAAMSLLYRIHDHTNGATHYYAHDLTTPYWSAILTPAAVIGRHTFMTE